MKLKTWIYILLASFIVIAGIISFWLLYQSTDKTVDSMKVPDWMRQRIQKELMPFKEHGVTKKEMEEINVVIDKVPNNDLIRYQIVDNKLYMYSSTINKPIAIKRSKYITQALNRLLAHNKINDVDFVLCMNDGYHPIKQEIKEYGLDSSNVPPIFTFAANKKLYKNENILFVDDITLSDNKIGYRSGWKTISQEILKANDQYPWHSKINKLFWRGKQTLPERKKLIEYAHTYPNYIDAKLITNIFTSNRGNKLNTLYETIMPP